MARDFRRQLDAAKAFTANAPISFDLPRDSVYKEIVLRLEAQFSATTSATGPFEGAPWTLIKRIELIADGKDTIKSYDGATLNDINFYDFGIYSPVEALTLGVSNTGLIDMALILSLESVGMAFPQTTWLDSRKLSSLELRVTFGAGMADVYTANVGGAVDTFRLTPWGHEILDIDPKSIFSVNQEVTQTFNFPSTTGTRQRFKLNVGNAYRRILISTRDQNARAVVDRLTRLELVENGIFNRRIWEMGMLKVHNAMKKSVVGIPLNAAGVTEHPVFPVVAAGGPAAGTSGGYRQGVYYLDIAEDGSENSLIDTRGYSDLAINFDWTGAVTTEIIRLTPGIWVPSVR